MFLLFMDGHYFLPRFGKFSFMSSLKICSIPLTWSFSSYVPVIGRFELFMMFQCTCIKHSWNFKNILFILLSDPFFKPTLHGWYYISYVNHSFGETFHWVLLALLNISFPVSFKFGFYSVFLFIEFSFISWIVIISFRCFFLFSYTSISILLLSHLN